MSRRIWKRVHGPALLSNSTATKYTVPANRRAIVRHIHHNNPTGGDVNFTWSIGADSAGTRVRDAQATLAGKSYDDYGPYTLEAGEIIAAFASTVSTTTLTIDVEEEVLT